MKTAILGSLILFSAISQAITLGDAIQATSGHHFIRLTVSAGRYNQPNLSFSGTGDSDILIEGNFYSAVEALCDSSTIQVDQGSLYCMTKN